MAKQLMYPVLYVSQHIPKTVNALTKCICYIGTLTTRNPIVMSKYTVNEFNISKIPVNMYIHSACTVQRMVAHRMIRAVCVTDFSHVSL